MLGKWPDQPPDHRSGCPRCRSQPTFHLRLSGKLEKRYCSHQFGSRRGNPATFVLAWGFLNFFWLAVLRRPGLSAALSLVMLIVLILLSRFKHDILFMTASFVDVMIIDADTLAFLMTVSSDLRYAVAAAFLVGVPTLVLLWRLDPFRIGLHAASIGGGSCLVGFTCLSLVFPIAPHNAFYSDAYVSNFVRSGVAAISELMTHGFLESLSADLPW